MPRPTTVLLLIVLGVSVALAGCTKSPTPATTTPTTSSPPASTTSPTSGGGGTGGAHAPVAVAFDIAFPPGPGCPQGPGVSPACVPATKNFDVNPGGWKTLAFSGNVTGPYFVGAHLTITDSTKGKAYDADLPATCQPAPPATNCQQKLTFTLNSNAPGTFAATLWDGDPVSAGIEVKGTITATY